MAKVNTMRPEASAWRGAEMKFVREVAPGEPSYDERMHQVVLADQSGGEVQFYGNEVELSDDERKAADKAKRRADDERKDREDAAKKNVEAKEAMMKQTAPGSSDGQQPQAPHGDADKAAAGGPTGGVAYGTPAMAGHESHDQVMAETSPFNRVPGEPQRHAADDGAGSHTGPGGYPEGSGPDPQGRRVNEKDQSHSDPKERPVPLD